MDRYRILYKKILSARLFRVLLIGGVGFAIQTVFFELLSVYMHVLEPSSATLIGAEIGVLCNFYLNNKFSFTDPSPIRSPVLAKLARFHIVVSGSLFIQWLFLFLTEHWTTNVWLIHGAYIAGVCIGFGSNFAGYHFWVWKKSNQNN